jgi:hypothetical protein
MDVAWAVILEGPLLTMSGRPAPEPAATPPAVTGLPEEDRVTLAMSAADTTVNQPAGDEFATEEPTAATAATPIAEADDDLKSTTPATTKVGPPAEQGMPAAPRRVVPLLIYARRDKATHGADPPRGVVEVPVMDTAAAQELDVPEDDAVCCTPPPGFGSPPPPTNTASAQRRFQAFPGKIKKSKPAAILRRPSPNKVVTPWQRPLRSRRITAQSLSRIPVARRGEYLVLKRLGQVSPLTESTAANKLNALFGGNPEDDEALRELFPDDCTVGGRRRRRRAPRAGLSQPWIWPCVGASVV